MRYLFKVFILIINLDTSTSKGSVAFLFAVSTD